MQSMANTDTLKSPKPQAGDAHSWRPAFAMLSHRGRVRRANQDVCAALPERGAFVVCDGIGGAAGGEVASRLASEAFLDSLRRVVPATKGASNSANHSRDCLSAAVKAANDAVFRYSRRSPGLSGMGTTLVAALLESSGAGTLWLANVGDSRCYRLRAGVLEQLTEDHSLVEEQVRAGTLSSIQAASSPIRNIITRAIGSQIDVEADIASYPVQHGDIYLLATDGLTHELTDNAIAGILAKTLGERSSGALDAACQALVDAANAHGGRDNVTVLLIGGL
jgi:serine/threonine protein phosphatase PrpC